MFHPSPSPRCRGSVLLLGLVVSVVLLLTLAAAATTTFTLGQESTYKLDRTGALSLAEGVTEAVQKRMLDDVANFETPELSGSIDLHGISYPYTITAVDPPFNVTDPDGVTRSVQHYAISSTTNAGDGFATVERVVDLSLTPIFQFMIFYNDDLELLPGPDMTLGGRVHANGDIYVGSGGTLNADTDYFQCTGHIYRKRKDDSSATGGTVDIRVQGQSTYIDMDPAHDSEDPDWTTYALDTWEGTVKDAAHGVTAVAAPKIESIKAFEADGVTPGYYHENADLVLVDGAAFDGDGNLLTLPADAITEKVLYDARQGIYVTVAELDIALLNASGAFPANGLLYAYRTASSPAEPNGIRLTGGSELAAPLTVVTENPLYVHGDFNTVNKKGAAVIADAVHLLSNAWDDSKVPTSLPTATETQYNLAFITGNVPTPDGGSGSYSGGFENLPRFHENWTDVQAIIRGSFIKLFESEIGTAPWGYGGDVYTAPNRDWAYDPDLNDLGNLPPFTPSAVFFSRVLWDDKMPLPFQAPAP